MVFYITSVVAAAAVVLIFAFYHDRKMSFIRACLRLEKNDIVTEDQISKSIKMNQFLLRHMVRRARRKKWFEYKGRAEVDSPFEYWSWRITPKGRKVFNNYA